MAKILMCELVTPKLEEEFKTELAFFDTEIGRDFDEGISGGCEGVYLFCSLMKAYKEFLHENSR